MINNLIWPTVKAKGQDWIRLFLALNKALSSSLLDIIQHWSCWILCSLNGVSSGGSARWNDSGCRLLSLWLLTRGQPCSPPSVRLLQESIKRPIWCCVSQGRDPCSALWQRQTLCWGLTFVLWAGVKNKQTNKTKNSCQHGVWRASD